MNTYNILGRWGSVIVKEPHRTTNPLDILEEAYKKYTSDSGYNLGLPVVKTSLTELPAWFMEFSCNGTVGICRIQVTSGQTKYLLVCFAIPILKRYSVNDSHVSYEELVETLKTYEPNYLKSLEAGLYEKHKN